MEIDENLKEMFETNYLILQLPFPDDFLLEMCLRELIWGQPEPTPPGLKLPFLEIPVLKKSEKISMVCCIAGEKAMTDKKNKEALIAFTNGLRVAPASSKIIAHCYYYRAMVLSKLKAYPESLSDIERALKLPISEEQKTSLSKRKKIVDLILNESNKKSEANKKSEENKKERIQLSYGESEEIKGVSSAMALAYNEEFGRHFVATRDIKIGDFLMIQSPLMWVKQRDSEDDSKGKKWFCDFCLNSTINPVPCESCTYSLYCSLKCRSEAFEKYHKIECQIANVRSPMGPQTTLFLRTLLVATKQGEDFQEVYNLMEKIKNCKDKRTSGFKDGKLNGDSANAVLSLLHHMDKQQLSGIVHHSIQIVVALVKNTNFLKKKNPIDVHHLGNLLVFLSYIVHMNLYRIRRNSFNDSIAFGMYPVFNLLNHSCACNTLSYDDKKRNKILRACKNIKKGEQIFVSYNTFQVIEMTVEERQKFMLQNKFFKCKCDICVRNYKYKCELKGVLKLPAHLKKKLRKKHNDTEILWEVLKLVLNEYKHPSWEAKMIEWALVDAHLGNTNLTQGLSGVLRRLFGL
ncbi:SET and MYND domain-containing protein 4-like [Belonocnema kinseyi]|uniref:SET and MYND domain-containing protein 4-like n=1 Tax=Belonocnema kinseyi TaxID=2817044 RepID=UPI00143DD4D5|nr:SET and MYND domain-containing protein 4-like [Belonocnema kinseyi]